MCLVDVENDVELVPFAVEREKERERERDPLQKKKPVVCMIPGVWMTRVAVWEKSGMCARCGRGGMSSCSTFTGRVYCGQTEKLSSCLA